MNFFFCILVDVVDKSVWEGGGGVREGRFYL